MSRNQIDWEGEGSLRSTFYADGSVSSVMLVSGASYVDGKAVALTGNGIAGYGSAGDPLLGRIHKYEDDHKMSVQIKGFTEFDGIEDALPTAGDFVVVDGSGNVSAASDGTAGPARAVSVDATNTKVMVLIA